MQGVDVPPSVLAAIRNGKPALQAYREHRGFGLTALAAASGVEASKLVQHESTGNSLTEAELRALAQALDVPVRELLTRAATRPG
jgi:transcriptional regulator with XRE-family HTH domain